MANKPAISTGGSPMKRLYHFANHFSASGALTQTDQSRQVAKAGTSCAQEMGGAYGSIFFLDTLSGCPYDPIPYQHRASSGTRLRLEKNNEW